ncbi:hypothetical protein HS088_TW21G00824 [Tripterygium wilfordii]|uniref:DUF1771 domain-containing protein n=1 Tax=Tripterygium wilfordii TaxID=458696 RepID=A0A7J7C3F1_TRIWF|nr:putative nuclear RNA export factor SDE5 [Tripterygium wilfordii]XP_038691155.1 putative nuclear RNA export factor SDE5 [Tripterygium wilfordii]KAF5728674.1 hypothetical protein HS088_TW21G00824 [Tripterygium wilfordii]
MEAPGITTSKYHDEEKALSILLDAFGSIFSLEEIATAYCKADRNADMAGDILYEMQGCTSTSTSEAFYAESKTSESSESSDGNDCQNPCQATQKSKASKLKWRPALGGTVSSIIGKDYLKTAPSSNISCMATKPTKLNSKEFQMSEMWVEKGEPSSAKDDRTHKDMENFLFKMLGGTFRLDMNEIRQVLDSCGYDMPKSMEKLLDQSTAALNGRNKLAAGSIEKQNLEKMKSPAGNGHEISNSNEGAFDRQQKQRDDLQKEVWAALFNASGISQELPKRTERAVQRSKAFGATVVEPPTEFTAEREIDVADVGWLYAQQNIIDDEDAEGGYHALRRAVREYRVTMKEYYKAAVEAFAHGDHALANKFLDQGNFFNEKAKQADEESSQKIFEINGSNADTQDEMLLDLHECGVREARRLLKLHLSSVAGISSIKYLKVITETNEQAMSKGSRIRMGIQKLLELESIEWTEVDTGSIRIRIDNINPKGLSFAKK